MLFSAQIRAARALVGWRQEDLSRASKVGLATVQRIEQQSGLAMGHTATLLRIQNALEEAGIRFLGPDDQGGMGVRLSK
jgi:transcriptional regulator with XRE-family HTH domain